MHSGHRPKRLALVTAPAESLGSGPEELMPLCLE